MSTSGSIIAGVVGIAAGEEIADSFVDDDNILGHVAVGIVGAGLVGGVSKRVVEETGIGEALDDIFGF